MTFNGIGKIVEREFDILFTVESEETNKHYIAYTDNSKDENGKLVVYASSYDPKDENTELFPIETEKEWKIIETILTTLQEEMILNIRIFLNL